MNVMDISPKYINAVMGTVLIRRPVEQFRIRFTSTRKFLNFRLCDIRGLETDMCMKMKDVAFVLDGHMPHARDAFSFIRLLVKFVVLGLFTLVLQSFKDAVVNPYSMYISCMLAFLSLYEAVPLAVSSIVEAIKAREWVRCLDYMNTILQSVNILSSFGYIICVIVKELLRFLHRGFTIYVLWSAVLSFVCFTVSDSLAAEYQQFFFSNFTYDDSFRKSRVLAVDETMLLETKTCITTKTLDISALLNNDNIIYRKDKSPSCDITEINNTTLQDFREEVKFPGEFAELHCVIRVPHASFPFGWNVEWKKDNKIIHADNQTIQIMTKCLNGVMISSLIIPFIREDDYGIYMCQIKRNVYSDHYLIHGTKTIPLRLKNVIYTNFYSKQILKKDPGIQDVIFVPLGNKLQIIWYPLSFGIDRENVTQTYFINGEETAMLKQKKDGCRSCSFLTNVYCICGYLRHWFMINIHCSLWDVVLHRQEYTFSVFSMCADTSIYGTHTIAYRRLVYDKEKKALTNMTVPHPDMVIVLPDNPYFTEMDNSSKFEKVNKMMFKLMPGDLKKESFQEVSDVVSLINRHYIETITFFIVPLALYFLFNTGKNISSIFPYALEIIQKPYWYTCYIFCCDEDSDDITGQLYNKLLKDDINAGIILNNCELNNPGRYNFEITADIINNSLSFIFFVTPSYLADTYCEHYHLIPVMENIKMGNILASKVLFVMVDNAVLPKDINLNTPNVPKIKWKTSNSYSAYNQVRKWLPVEVCRFPEWSFMEGFALIRRRNVMENFFVNH